MKRIVLYLALFASVIAAGSCNLVRHDAKAYFWAIERHNDPQVLFIDGKNAGSLPQIAETKDEEDDTILKNALMVNIPTGSYELELKNQAGNLLHTGMLEMKKSAGSESLTLSWDKDADCKVKVVYQ